MIFWLLNKFDANICGALEMTGENLMHPFLSLRLHSLELDYVDFISAFSLRATWGKHMLGFVPNQWESHILKWRIQELTNQHFNMEFPISLGFIDGVPITAAFDQELVQVNVLSPKECRKTAIMSVFLCSSGDKTNAGVSSWQRFRSLKFIRELSRVKFLKAKRNWGGVVGHDLASVGEMSTRQPV